MFSVAIGMVGVAIALLLIYAADVAVIESTEQEQGFLPIDAKARGMGLGLPALILPFIAYGIARKTPSALLGAMIIVTGALIMFGGAFVLVNADPVQAEESGRPVNMEAGMLLVAGAIHMGLGAFKIRRSI